MSTLIWAAIAVAVVVMWGIGIVDIVRRHLGATKTVAWLLIVLILPVLGTILYWLLREPDPGDFQQAEAAQRARRQSRHDQPFDSTGFGV
jgi:hypothetical protein